MIPIDPLTSEKKWYTFRGVFRSPEWRVQRCLFKSFQHLLNIVGCDVQVTHFQKRKGRGTKMKDDGLLVMTASPFF